MHFDLPATKVGYWSYLWTSALWMHLGQLNTAKGPRRVSESRAARAWTWDGCTARKSHCSNDRMSRESSRALLSLPAAWMYSAAAAADADGLSLPRRALISIHTHRRRAGVRAPGHSHVFVFASLLASERNATGCIRRASEWTCGAAGRSRHEMHSPRCTLRSPMRRRRPLLRRRGIEKAVGSDSVYMRVHSWWAAAACFGAGRHANETLGWCVSLTKT